LEDQCFVCEEQQEATPAGCRWFEDASAISIDNQLNDDQRASLEAVFLSNRVIVFSDRPARIKADIAVDRPYPRHRDDARLAELLRNILELLGLDATW
jgi:hypothetical protein